MKNVFVLGSINLDYIIQVNSIPEKGETVLGGNIQKAYGGKGANQAVALAKLGANVTMIGAVGNDNEGVRMVANLALNDINTDYITTHKTSSGVAMILVDKEDNQIVVSPGANKLVSYENVVECLKTSDKNDYFVTQFENDISIVFKSLKHASEKGLTTILNPSPYQDFDLELLDYVDYLIVNETEINNISEAEGLKNKLHDLETKCNIVLTLGKDGSVYHDLFNHVAIPSIKVNTIDTTAAGDTFLGCFIVGLIEELSIEENLTRSNKAGALATTKIGAQSAIPTKEDLLNI